MNLAEITDYREKMKPLSGKIRVRSIIKHKKRRVPIRTFVNVVPAIER